jgi:hypothetical protein
MYGVAKSNIFIIVKEFYETISKHLKPLVKERLPVISIRKMTNEFKELQDMLYAFGVVLDDIHIPIIAPSINPSFYCCQKGLYYKAQLIQYVRFEKMILDGLVALMIGQFF